MSWTCPGHYKVHVHGRDSPGRPVHGHCPVPLPALVMTPKKTAVLQTVWTKNHRRERDQMITLCDLLYNYSI